MDVVDSGQIGNTATNKPPMIKSPFAGNLPACILMRVDLRDGGDCQAGGLSCKEIAIPSQPLKNAGGSFPPVAITPQELMEDAALRFGKKKKSE